MSENTRVTDPVCPRPHRATSAIHVLAATAMLGICAFATHADEFDPPPGYYDTAVGTGAALQAQLHNIIDDHIVRSYDDARISLQITDVDPVDPNAIILVYSGVSLDISGLYSVGIPGWDSGLSWNREHTWPRSRGVGTSGPDNSDLHNLRPCNPSVNGSRGNLNFGGAFGVGGAYGDYGITSDAGATVWYSGLDAGHVARQMFYMATRYDGSDASTTNLQLVVGDPASGGSTLGNLDRLLEYHYAAPAAQFERRRNHIIYANYQGNRNPYIDHPEFVWSVFGGGNNDSQLYVGGSPASDGASSITVDLGQVNLGDPLPSPQTVVLHKDGFAPTYYSVTAAGEATSSLSGGFNAFSMNAQTANIEVGLLTSTAIAGLKSGTVTIDNLDVDGAATGQGSADANDVITVILEVIAPAIFPFDDNGNGFVELAEFETFEGCMTGPGGTLQSPCDNHDADLSGDVDTVDFAEFQAAFTGS